MNFEDLFVFEVANNHQGSVSHGKKIIDEMSKIALKYNLKAAIKLPTGFASKPINTNYGYH